MLSLLIPAVLLAAGPPATPAETAAEARHLKNIRQVTFGFARAGEGYFRPDGQAIIFQAVPNARSIFHAEAERGRLPDLHARPRPRRQARSWSAPARASAPARTTTPTASRSSSPRRTSTPPSRGQAEPRPEGPGLQPDRSAYRWDFDPAHGHLPGRPRRLEPRPPDRHARLRRRGELLARRQADRLHLVPRRRRRDLHHGRRRQEPAADHRTPRATTAARSSRPTASGSSTGATARRTTCSRSTSTTPRGPPSGP